MIEALAWSALLFVGICLLSAGYVSLRDRMLFGHLGCSKSIELRNAEMFIKAHGLHEKYKEFIK